MKKPISIVLLALLIWMFPRSGNEKLSAAPSIKYTRIGKASWYSRKSPGINKRTASNELFNDQDLTCAMWGISFNRLLKVTNLDNGKSIIVRVNDRGPHQRFVRQGRIVDLTEAAFRRLGTTNDGLINVEIEFL